MRSCNWAAGRGPSRTRARRWSSCTTACPPRARTAGHPSASTWALNGVLGPLFPAGFYYKTFMWPQSWWRSVYERLIRRAAGLGRAPRAPDPDRYEHMHAHCDVLVVGAGPAGLMAALAAGRSGARVILVDEQPELGGALLSEPVDHPAPLGCARLRPSSMPAPSCAAHAHHGVRLLRSQFPGLLERVTDHLPPDAAPHLPRQRLWKIRARQVVLATGALERPLVFAATTGRASCWRARRALTSTAMRSGPAGAPWSSPTTTARIAARSTCCAPASG